MLSSSLFIHRSRSSSFSQTKANSLPLISMENSGRLSLRKALMVVDNFTLSISRMK